MVALNAPIAIPTPRSSDPKGPMANKGVTASNTPVAEKYARSESVSATNARVSNRVGDGSIISVDGTFRAGREPAGRGRAIVDGQGGHGASNFVRFSVNVRGFDNESARQACLRHLGKTSDSVGDCLVKGATGEDARPRADERHGPRGIASAHHSPPGEATASCPATGAGQACWTVGGTSTLAARDPVGGRRCRGKQAAGPRLPALYLCKSRSFELKRG